MAAVEVITAACRKLVSGQHELPRGSSSPTITMLSTVPDFLNETAVLQSHFVSLKSMKDVIGFSIVRNFF